MIPKSTSGRWLAGIGVGVIALAVLSTVIALTLGSRTVTLPAGTPERAVQEYLIHLQEDEYDQAYALLAPELQEECARTEFYRAHRFESDGGIRIHFKSARKLAEGTEVVMEMTHTSGTPLFGGGEWTNEQRYLVVERAEGWRLLEAQWPYTGCRLLKPTPAKSEA